MKITIRKTKRKETGAVLVEVLIAIAIISIALTVLLSVSALSVKTSAQLDKKTSAMFLAKEGIEAVRSFRDGTSWTGAGGLGALSLYGQEYPYKLVLDTVPNPPKWNLAQGAELIGIFTRKIIIDRVSRDPTTNNIESFYEPPVADDDTRKVTVIIEWEANSLQLVTYFTNWN